jgi:hypothetical protein
VAADKTDQPGVLGNLPRSRPGHRSDKRRGGATAVTKASAAPRAKPARKAARPAPPRPAVQAEPRRAAPEEPQRSADPLTGAVRLAGKVAEAGLKTAGGLLRRLPGR